MDVREAAKLFASAGGKARAAKLTKDQLSAIGSHAARTRWARIKPYERSWIMRQRRKVYDAKLIKQLANPEDVSS